MYTNKAHTHVYNITQVHVYNNKAQVHEFINKAQAHVYIKVHVYTKVHVHSISGTLGFNRIMAIKIKTVHARARTHTH